MALRSKIEKAVYDTLPPDVKKEYKQADGSEDFVLDVEGLDDLPGFISARDALSRAKSNEVAEHGKTKTKLAEAQAEIEDLKSKDTTRTNDTKRIEDGWKKKLDDAKAEGKAATEKLESQLSGVLVDAEAMRIAQEISTSPELIFPHIKARLKADLTGDEPVTVVLGKDGQPSTMKTAELAKEFVADKKFSAIITASKASGSGANPQKGGSGSATYQGKKFADLNEAERLAWHREDPAAFKTASDEHKSKATYG